MRQICKLVIAVFASITGIACGLHAASAQDVSSPGGYQFFVTPYLWLASVHATTMTPLAREPQVNSNVSTIDLLSHLDGVPFMGSFEVALRGPRAFSRDAIHLPVSTKITTHDVLFQGGNAALKADTGTGIALYRLFEDPVQFADAGLGFRAWGFSMDLNLNPGLLPGDSGEPLRRLGRPADRRALSPRARQRVRADSLWRCRRLRGRRAYRLAGARHDRLFPQPIVEPAPRLSQPQFQYYRKRKAILASTSICGGRSLPARSVSDPDPV